MDSSGLINAHQLRGVAAGSPTQRAARDLPSQRKSSFFFFIYIFDVDGAADGGGDTCVHACICANAGGGGKKKKTPPRSRDDFSKTATLRRVCSETESELRVSSSFPLPSLFIKH